MTATLPALDLGRLCEEASDDVSRLRLLRELEELKATASAVQARVAVAYADSKIAAAQDLEAYDPEAGELDSARRRQRLVASRIGTELGKARRLSPHAGRAFLRTARALVEQMPHTLAALEAGKLSEQRAEIVVRETSCLTAADRTHVDDHISRDHEKVSLLGNQALAAAVKTAAYRIDPQVVTHRAAYATSQRRVTMRPAPDTMVWLTALLPVAQGVAAYAALTKHADSVRAIGDVRSRSQVMADTLVERLTGQATATGVPVHVNLVMGEKTLLGKSEDAATVQGYGPIPASVARTIVKGSGVTPGDRVGSWIRRLYANPSSGDLVAMESKARFFPAKLAEMITIRDQRCRTVYCDAPVSHIDHVTSHAKGGPTSFRNGQGLCEHCNYVKETPGWPPPETGPPPDPPWGRGDPGRSRDKSGINSLALGQSESLACGHADPTFASDPSHRAPGWSVLV